MIRAGLAAIALAACQPAHAARPPEGIPASYLVAVFCDVSACRATYVAVYGISRQGCMIGAQAELARRLRAGEYLADWWCE